MKDGDAILRVIDLAGLGGKVRPRYATMVMPGGRVRVSIGVRLGYRRRVAALADDMARALGAPVKVERRGAILHVDVLRSGGR